MMPPAPDSRTAGWPHARCAVKHVPLSRLALVPPPPDSSALEAAVHVEDGPRGTGDWWRSERA
jgi:hypothetical protein